LKVLLASAIDDQTAIKVTDDGVNVVSEGHWRCSSTNFVNHLEDRR